MISFIRTVFYNIAFHSAGTILVIVALIASYFGEKGSIWGARNWALWQQFCACTFLGVRIRVEGSLNQGQALYVLKHQSMFEAMQTLALFDRPIVVMKSELLDIPIWGRASRAHGSIGVDRDAGSAAMRAMIAAAKRAKETGRPIILFPEGTRVPVGEAPPLKAGMAGLYKILGLPVIPVALDAGRLWSRSFAKQSGVVTFKVGEVIPAGLPREEIEARVHAAINVLKEPA